MSNRKGFRPIEPRPARSACLVAAFLAGVVAFAAVAAGSALDVVVGLVAAGVLASLALFLRLVDAAPLLDDDELPVDVRATAPRTAPVAGVDESAGAWCGLCSTNPAALDGLCSPCLAIVQLRDQVVELRRSSTTVQLRQLLDDAALDQVVDHGGRR